MSTDYAADEEHARAEVTRLLAVLDANKAEFLKATAVAFSAWLDTAGKSIATQYDDHTAALASSQRLSELKQALAAERSRATSLVQSGFNEPRMFVHQTEYTDPEGHHFIISNSLIESASAKLRQSLFDIMVGAFGYPGDRDTYVRTGRFESEDMRAYRKTYKENLRLLHAMKGRVDFAIRQQKAQKAASQWDNA